VFSPSILKPSIEYHAFLVAAFQNLKKNEIRSNSIGCAIKDPLSTHIIVLLAK
jgi:hypothetical protein